MSTESELNVLIDAFKSKYQELGSRIKDGKRFRGDIYLQWIGPRWRVSVQVEQYHVCGKHLKDYSESIYGDDLSVLLAAAISWEPLPYLDRQPPWLMEEALEVGRKELDRFWVVKYKKSWDGSGHDLPGVGYKTKQEALAAIPAIVANRNRLHREWEEQFGHLKEGKDFEYSPFLWRPDLKNSGIYNSSDVHRMAILSRGIAADF